MRLWRRIIVVALTGAGALLAPAVAQSSVAPDGATCADSGPQICVLLTTDPGSAVSLPAPKSDSYVRYRAAIRNDGSNSATHLTATFTLPDGTTFATGGSTPACAAAGQTVTCTLDRLPSGAHVTADVVAKVTATTTGTLAPVKLVTDVDERTNDGPTADPKQDTITLYGDALQLVQRDGTSVTTFVPSDGTAHFVTTDGSGTGVASPGNTEVVAGVNIPAVANPLVASLTRLTDSQAPFAFTCPATLTCGGGGWVKASVPGYRSSANPLLFTLRWDAVTIPSGTTAKKFFVLYQEDDFTKPLKVVVACDASGTLPCLRSVTKERDGDYTTVLANDHNGYMRK